jgi:hypothetical protein
VAICSARAIVYTELGENVIQRTEPGESALKQIQSDKRGEEQEILANKNRACFHSKRQRQQDEGTGNDTDNTFCIHYLKLL